MTNAPAGIRAGRMGAPMLDKGIFHGKEHRKPYRGAKAHDRGCRNHGSCSYCRCNRLHKATVAGLAATTEMQDYWGQTPERE